MAKAKKKKKRYMSIVKKKLQEIDTPKGQKRRVRAEEDYRLQLRLAIEKRRRDDPHFRAIEDNWHRNGKYPRLHG